MLPVAGKKTTRASRAKSAAMNGMPAHTNESVKVKNTEVEVEENEMDHATGVKPARSAKNTGEVKVGKSAKAVKGDEKKSVAPSGDESVSKQTTKGKKTKAADTKPAEANGKKVHKNFNESGKEIPTEKKAEASNAKEDIKWDSNKNGKRNSDAITGNEDNMMSKKPKKAQTQATTEKQSKRVPAKASKIAKNSTLAKESKVTKNLKTAKSVEGKSGNKKRKQSDDEDSTDASSDSGMVKKLKTSVKQGGSEILNKVKATLETVTNAVSGGQTSIIDDIADLAKDATQSNPKGNKSSTKGQKSAKSAVEPTEAETKAKNDSVADDVSAEDGDGDHWEPEDEVAQLITGFESASEDEESGDEGFKQGKAIPKLSKQVTLVLEEQMGNKSDGPGVIYVG